MESPREHIATYLSDHHVAEGRQLPVAIAFTQSMLRELAATVTEWEEMAAKLRRLERARKAPCSN